MSQENWIRTASIDDMEPGEGFETDIEINGETIALFRINDDFYALGECTHESGPLCQGIIEGTTVTCPWHSAKFDITSGKNIETPSACRVSGDVAVGKNLESENLSDCNVYQVKVEDNEIYVLDNKV
ncbi:MAG: Rieske 2Fe-2S domain-containing protein [Thiotrichaceae bacterium]|nr:Rieske 2Fe-2S domain-containing protein [Thiotrichaceae bacterium]